MSLARLLIIVSHSEGHDLCLPGMLRIDGIMEGKARMFDTPGVPHDHQLSSRLSPDEVPSLPLLVVAKQQACPRPWSPDKPPRMSSFSSASS